MLQLCFVCLGNICRSPTAEGIMLHLLEQAKLGQLIKVDSAGTGGYHIGEPADSRSLQAAAARGIDLPSRARKFVQDDFQRFDYILAMDRLNLATLRQSGARQYHGKIYLLRDFDANSPPDSDVPDPYYGGPLGFEEVLDLCFAACQGLLKHLRERHQIA